jgi:hypothetical protein
MFFGKYNSWKQKHYLYECDQSKCFFRTPKKKKKTEKRIKMFVSSSVWCWPLCLQYVNGRKKTFSLSYEKHKKRNMEQFSKAWKKWNKLDKKVQSIFPPRFYSKNIKKFWWVRLQVCLDNTFVPSFSI